MLTLLGAAALKDIIGMLKQEPGFFSLSVSQREKILEKHLSAYPAVFSDYLKEVPSHDFMQEVHEAVQVFTGIGFARESDFLTAMSAYIAHFVGLALDQLDMSFFFISLEERYRTLETLLPGDSVLARAARDIFAAGTYQEITAMASEALNTLKDIPVIIIQTPRELSVQQRQTIRNNFLKSHPYSFPEFSINPQLIGGMRIFINGQVADHSWLAKVQAITSLTN